MYLKKSNKIILIILLLIIACEPNKITDMKVEKKNKMNIEENAEIEKKASKYLKKSYNKLNNGEIEEANKLVETGIYILGDSYQSSYVIDDTGMKLALAMSEEKKGNILTATNIRINVLRSRLTQIAEKNRSQ